MSWFIPKGVRRENCAPFFLLRKLRKKGDLMNTLNDKGRSLAELKQGLAQLEAERESHCDKRQAAGLPREAPAAFVQPAHAEAMIEQLRPLQEVLTQYLALTNGAKRLIPFDTAVFAQYKRLITLVHESTDSGQLIYAEMLKRSIAIIDEAQQGGATVEYVISKLYRYLTIADNRDERIRAYMDGDLSEVIADYWKFYMENIAEDRRLAHELS